MRKWLCLFFFFFIIKAQAQISKARIEGKISTNIVDNALKELKKLTPAYENAGDDFLLSSAKSMDNGYAVKFQQYKDDILVDGGEVRIRLNAEGDILYTVNHALKINGSFSQIHSLEEVYGNILKSYSFNNPEISSSSVVIKNVKEKFELIHVVNIKENPGYKRLTFEVIDRSLDIANIYYSGTEIEYKERGSDKLNTMNSMQRFLGPNAECCPSNPTSIAYLHLIDPYTNPNCVGYNGFSTTFASCLFGTTADRIDASGTVVFANGQSVHLNLDGIFCYNSEDDSASNLECSDETNKIDYARMHGLYYGKLIFGSGFPVAPGFVTINCDIFNNNFVVQANSNEMTFGNPIGYGNFAADAFHVIQAYIQLSIAESGGPGGFLQSACADFLAHDYMESNVPAYVYDGLCGRYGGMSGTSPGPGYVQRKTNFPLYTSAITSTSSVLDNKIQAFSSLLRNIQNGLAGVQGIGESKTKQLLYDSYAMMGFDIVTASKAMFDEAKFASYISNEELCNIRKIMTDYFNGAQQIEIPVLDPILDYYIKDTETDMGVEPHTTSWMSPDIWNRLSNDLLEGDQPPVATPNGHNYLHVKVRDIGCTSPGEEVLHLYYSPASTGLMWPNSWIQLGVGQAVNTVPSGGEKIFSFEWDPPVNPNPNIPEHHVCILARITNGSNQVKNSPRTEIQTPEYTGGNSDNLAKNQRNFNSIAWRNMTVTHMGGIAPDHPVAVNVINTNEVGSPVVPDVLWPAADFVDIDFDIETPPTKPGVFNEGDSDPDFFVKGDLILELVPPLDRLWNYQQDGTSTGLFELIGPGKVRVLSDNFSFRNLPLVRGVTYQIISRYIPKVQGVNSSYSLVQRDNGIVVGGEVYQIIGADIQHGHNPELTARNMNTFNIYPNPAENTIEISVNSGRGEVDEIIVRNEKGEIVIRKTGEAGKTGYKFDVSDLSVGIYFVEIMYRNLLKDISKFIKM